MARLYADEDFHGEVAKKLRSLGHEVMTAREAGQADQKIPDSKVLAYATSLGRAVLTHNRRDFLKLHTNSSEHGGIVVCTADDDLESLAERIHNAVSSHDTLAKKLIRVNKPSRKR